MNTRPVPIRTDIVQKSDTVSSVTLAFDETSANTCSRCHLCTVKPGPTAGQFTCTNEMAPSAVHAFMWGSRVDREAATAAPAPTATPVPAKSTKPAKPRRSRRGPSPEAIEAVIADLVAALAVEKAFNNEDVSDAEFNRAQDRSGKAVAKLENIAAKIHGDRIYQRIDDDGEPVALAFETDGHLVVTITADILEMIGGDRPFTIAVAKDSIVKLAESASK
jgi:hypothetical protein